MRRRWLLKITAFAASALGLLMAGAYMAFNVFEIGAVVLPPPQLVEVVRLQQGWELETAHWYHYESQGTRIVPLKWFMALERPTLNPWPAGLLADRDYLARFGFLYEDANKVGPHDLPIGFAIEEAFFAPYAKPPVKKPTVMVGLTCAACHTGRLDVVNPETGKVRGLLIEGGSATINLSKFQEAVGLSLAYTSTFPDRFRRFARRYFEKDLQSDDPKYLELKAEVSAYLSQGLVDQGYAKEHKLYPLEAGFARTDALGLIGNRVFGVIGEDNQSVTDAPVNFPHLWDTSWFDWVQYNASIRMPMVRNIGEALGVGAAVNLDPDESGRAYASTVRVDNLEKMENALGGQEAFSGLQPPRWDEELLGPLDKVRVDAGRLLYATHCQHCHYPPRNELRRLRDEKGEEHHKYWLDDPESKKSILKLRVVDINEIGTDPNQALNFYRRVAIVPQAIRPKRNFPRAWSGVETVSAEAGLYQITSYIRTRKYEELKLLAPPRATEAERLKFDMLPHRVERRLAFDRFRQLPQSLVLGEPGAVYDTMAMNQVIISNLEYKARPLDGIWATPPFLHNGSVPSLYQILVPVTKRDKKFYLGSMKFDRVVVGYDTDEIPGGFLLDTSLPGNLNGGHEFRNLTLEEFEEVLDLTRNMTLPLDIRWAAVLAIEVDVYRSLSEPDRWEKVQEATGKALKTSRGLRRIRGIIGQEFREEERWQLVEYLKSI
jgi:hypothetical protein